MKPGTTNIIVKEDSRNWLDLPRDVLIHIFIKLGTVDVLYTAQRVCSLWRNISKEPQLFRCVDMRNRWDFCGGRNFIFPQYITMTKEALSRCSIGELAKFSMESFVTDELVELAIAKSRPSLRCLRIANTYHISEEAFVKIVAANPMLEEIELCLCHFDPEMIEAVGRSCQLLKSFRMTSLIGKLDYDLNEYAYAIANSMPGLRRLHLFANKIDNKGLQAILDKCPHLEYLDLRRCFRVDLKWDLLMKKRVERIQNLRLPNDSTDDL